jgi:hemerythrin-like domain-containing protein
LRTPDLTTYLAVHAALRSGAHRLAAGAATLEAADRRRLGAFRTYFDGYAGEVLAHHTIEDDYFFPALAEQVGAATARIDRLERDHADLDELMTAVTDGLARIGAGTLTGAEVAVSLSELAVHMDEHLDFEDAEILPRFARHFSVEQYEALEAQAQKSLGIGKQAAFTIPFIVASVPPELREQLLGGAPAPLRILYRMTKGRHARLTVAAFGPDPVERAA